MKTLVIAFGLSLALIGCGGSANGAAAPTAPPPEGSTGAQPNYAAVDAQIFSAKCTTCHGDVNPKGGVKLNTYPNVFTNRMRARDMIRAGFMPPTGPLQSDLVQLLENWIDAGAPE